MIMDIGTEEIGPVEMLATMIARRLESSPVEAQEDAAKNSLVGAVMGGSRVEDVVMAGMNPQYAIVPGAGAMPVNSVGAPTGSRTPPAPNFPQELEDTRVSYQFLNHSEGTESSEGLGSDAGRQGPVRTCGEPRADGDGHGHAEPGRSPALRHPAAAAAQDRRGMTSPGPAPRAPVHP